MCFIFSKDFLLIFGVAVATSSLEKYLFYFSKVFLLTFGVAVTISIFL